MKTGFLITARMKSTRLPKKAIKKVNGRELLSWMIERIKLSKTINEIIICTSKNEDDNILEEIADRNNVKCFRGSEEDVILRLYEASKEHKLDYAINITADCPLVSYNYIDKIFQVYKKENADLIRCLDLPHGFFSYGLKVEALRKVCKYKSSEHTEVWGKLFEKDEFEVFDIDIPKSLIRPNYRLTIDYPDDFIFFEKIFQEFGDKTYQISDKEILKFLDDNPQIVAINSYLQKEYEKRWNSQSKLVDQ